MQIALKTKIDKNLPTVIALFEGQGSQVKLHGKRAAELIMTNLKRSVFKGEAGEKVSTQLIHKSKIQKLILFGLGKEKSLNEKKARNFGAKLIRAARTFKESKIHIIVPETLQDYMQAFTEGLILGNYNAALYKTGAEARKISKKIINTVRLQAKKWSKNQTNSIKKADLLSNVVNFTRSIVNQGPDKMNTAAFVREVRLCAKHNGYRYSDFDQKKLKKMGMGGVLAVNRGSKDPAHMLVLEHNPKLKEPPILLVGKGIIFDTGGISLKPGNSLHEMQLDMAGAGTVLAVFKVLKKLKINRKVIGIMPVTDNAINERAYHPSDIVKMYSGHTVEIVNTDAEGRMILADALHYGIKKYKPRFTIDLATLTGACMVALGYRTAGIMGNNETLIDFLKESGKNTDELLTELPITDVDEKSMKGKMADLTNLDSSSRYAGAQRAAAFLKNFVDKANWAHIDIAGTAFTKEPKDYEVNMGTGFGVRLLVDFLENL